MTLHCSSVASLSLEMGRRSSGGRSAPRRSSSRSVSKPAASPPPAPVQGGNGSVFQRIASAVTEGFGLGTGMSIADRAVDAVFGPRVIHHETVRVIQHETVASSIPAQTISSGISDACGGQSKDLHECLDNFGSDISRCQFFMDMLRECRSGSETSLSD